MRSLILLTAVAVLAAGCGGDDPVVPVDTTYDVTVTVVDAAGAPLRDVNVNIVNDVFIDLDKSGAAAVGSQDEPGDAVVTVPILVLEESVVRIVVYDVEGVVVRRLDGLSLAPGRHDVEWDGRDTDGAAAPSGRYTLTAIAYPPMGSTPFFTGQADVFLKRSGASYVVGVTNAEGTFRTTAQSILPGLYALPDMVATDEAGNRIGTLEVQETATISVWRDGETVVSDAIAVTYGPNDIRIVYGPAAPAAEDAVAPVSITGPRSDGAKDDDPEWKLGDPYPNPFS